MKALLFSLLMLFMVSCDQLTNPLDQENTLRIVATYQPQTLQNAMYKTTAADSLHITRVRFLMRHIKFKSAYEDSVDYVSQPRVVDFPLDGTSVELADSTIPAGTYEEVEFKIHRLDDDDPVDLAYFNHPDFADFVVDNRYSVIIDGTIYENGASAPFTYRSRKDAEQELEFPVPLVVQDMGLNAQVTFTVVSSNWFVDEDGNFLDPRIESNFDEIAENIKDAIDVEVGDRDEDDDHQGSDDD